MNTKEIKIKANIKGNIDIYSYPFKSEQDDIKKYAMVQIKEYIIDNIEEFVHNIEIKNENIKN